MKTQGEFQKDVETFRWNVSHAAQRSFFRVAAVLERSNDRKANTAGLAAQSGTRGRTAKDTKMQNEATKLLKKKGQAWVRSSKRAPNEAIFAANEPIFPGWAKTCGLRTG